MEQKNMGEHKREKPDRIQMMQPEKPRHPLGWACEDCLHVVKDSQPMSTAMKCTAHPPAAQALFNSMGQIAGAVSISPPVKEGEWCGEFNARDMDAAARVEARAKENLSKLD
jgi:hypothetical protein